MAKSKKQVPVEKIKTLIEVSVYGKKYINKKKFSIVSINKDGSTTHWGITRNNHTFKRKVYLVTTEDEIKKIFNKAKKEKNYKKNNISMLVKNYTGKYYRKSEKIVMGRLAGAHYFNIDKKGSRMIGKKKTIYNSNYKEVINVLKDKANKYKLLLKFA